MKVLRIVLTISSIANDLQDEHIQRIIIRNDSDTIPSTREKHMHL